MAEAELVVLKPAAPEGKLANLVPLPVQDKIINYESADSLSLYLREVGEVALLTPADEIMLAARIKAGDMAARERMIRANLRLVIKIAREYQGCGLPLMDMINEGNIGLMRAVEKFDPTKGGKVSTYSSWWIKQSIRRAIANQAKTVRVPIHLQARIATVGRAVAKLTEKLGQEPTNEELALEIGMTPAQAAKLRSAGVRISSMDAPLGDYESGRTGDHMADEQSKNPYDQLEEKTMLDLLPELVDRLPQREVEILRLRFGLDGGPNFSLEEVARLFDLSRERIRQLQNKALKKLRGMKELIEARFSA